jgi:hypothetical protein
MSIHDQELYIPIFYVLPTEGTREERAGIDGYLDYVHKFIICHYQNPEFDPSPCKPLMRRTRSLSLGDCMTNQSQSKYLN